MTNLLSILVFCGGQSTEHDISLLSAKNVIERLDPQKYRVSVVKISQEGAWHYFKSPEDYFSHSHSHSHLMHIVPGQKNPLVVNGQEITVDCVFPVLHGTNGEDGTIQGLFQLLNIPFVGADCLGSAIGMDKEVLKRLLEAAGLPVVPRVLLHQSNRGAISYEHIKEILGDVVFVKPNSLGSAVGVKKATNKADFIDAISAAFVYDEYILVEKAIVGREIECSVLGNENPRASLLGEIINHADFYSYDAKYLDADAATVQTPAALSPGVMQQLQTMAVKAYQTLRCIGMARVDFFLDHAGTVYLNEINTIPGFTDISMYPKNWEVSGLSYPALLDALIELGMQHFQATQALNRVFKVATVSA